MKKTEEQVKKITTIFCDGACQGNPGKSGSGLVVYNSNGSTLYLSGAFDSNGTNNTAELIALREALRISASIKDKCIIKSDSQYSINCVTNWAYNWRQNSWTKKGGEIKNLDIIKECLTIYDSIKNRVVVEHVKGHSGIEGNEIADRLAGLAIKKEYKEFYSIQRDAFKL